MTAHPCHFALGVIFFLLPITGATRKTFVIGQNITATVGSTVTLGCHLLIQDTKVIQVNWNFCNDVHIAFHVNQPDTEGMVLAEFSHRVSLAKDYGITVSGVNRNDSGHYCCVYNTFPQGSFTGKIYLQVISEDTWTPGYYLWIGCGLGGLLVIVVIGAGSFYYKKKKSRPSYSNVNLSGAKPSGSSTQNPAAVTAASDIEENAANEYFNVILYSM
ncbi:T-cell immunoreceptor with Ig and ITIM domains [Bufo bufo]|uniref:T-cell immunoreceptor with Ig and ITIM domains n=1 Tax=Bufo bufo TaxID=8384 RepID=UPI001ABE1049|nr:T-cell immunoreceptor with Ig and ITIM domains [Bufo bufo]